MSAKRKLLPVSDEVTDEASVRFKFAVVREARGSGNCSQHRLVEILGQANENIFRQGWVNEDDRCRVSTKRIIRECGDERKADRRLHFHDCRLLYEVPAIPITQSYNHIVASAVSLLDQSALVSN